MEINLLRQLLEGVKEGRLTIEEALHRLKFLPYQGLEVDSEVVAHIDHHRALRRGFPEVIFGQGKRTVEIVEIVKSMLKQGSNILITKASERVYRAVHKIDMRADYNKLASTITIIQSPVTQDLSLPSVLIITAGTSDIPIAEESAVTIEIIGIKTEKLYDVGVAGIHRLLNQKEKLTRAGIIIVVAGMEGALASVVGGLVDVPIIAVPTSVGYGASFRGLAALLTMLNSCAPGIAVVNIDNGFGAGYFAGMLIKKINEKNLV
ncbi:MAG: nickel pincer cofactor biosynthesis protein LarB [bacterium]